MKFLILNGPSCVGKSTTVKEIMKRKDRLFHLSYDSLKWSFSQYSPEKYFEQVRIVQLAVAASVFQMKYDVICDSALYSAYRQKLIALGNQYNYEIIEINLEADSIILSQRFDERVQRALTQPEVRMSNFSKERHEELCTMYQNEKNDKALTFRTDTQSTKEIVSEIMKIF